MSLDRKAMVDMAGYGYPTLNEDPSGMGELYKSWSDPSVIEAFGKFGKHDAEAAKELLDEAGYVDKDGDGFRDNPDGSKISFSVIVPNGWTDWIDTVQIAIEGMQEAGLDAKIATPEEAVWAGNLINGKFRHVHQQPARCGATLLSLSAGVQRDRQGQDPLHCAALDQCRSGEMLDEYTRTADPAAQKDVMDKAQLNVAENLPLMPGLQQSRLVSVQYQALHRLVDGRQSVRRPVDLAHQSGSLAPPPGLEAGQLTAGRKSGLLLALAP